MTTEHSDTAPKAGFLAEPVVKQKPPCALVNPDRGGNNTVPASNVELISASEMKRAYYHNHRSSGQLGQGEG